MTEGPESHLYCEKNTEIQIYTIWKSTTRKKQEKRKNTFSVIEHNHSLTSTNYTAC